MGMLSCGAKAERLPRVGLSCHEGYNAERNHVPNAGQHGGRQCHKNLAGHDIIIPEDGS